MNRIFHMRSQNFASTASKPTRHKFFSCLVAKTCEKTGYKIVSWKWITKDDFYTSLWARNISGMRHQNRIKDREREREKKFLQIARTQEHISRPIKYLLQRRLQILFSEQRGLYESFGTKKSRTKRPRRDRATQIARSEKRNKGGTFKTGARRSNEPTTQNI